MLGPDHPDKLISRGSLAEAYLGAGRLDEAINLHTANLPAEERLLGPDHPATLSTRTNFAFALQMAGRPEEAIALHEKNLAYQESLLGHDHPDTQRSRRYLAGLADGQGGEEFVGDVGGGYSGELGVVVGGGYLYDVGADQIERGEGAEGG